MPPPHEVEREAGRLRLGPSIRLSAPDEWASAVGRYLWLLNEVLEARKAKPVELVKKPSDAAIRVVRKVKKDLPDDGYELVIGKSGVELTAANPSGVFNGLATLAQLIELCGCKTLELPRGRVRDWPELATRAVHIDLTTQQYKVAYVQRLMRTLARYKVNAILMEYSDMFPFRRHKGICRPDALSESDIVAIRRTAGECNQEIIPFLQCLGHLEYILHKPGYERYGKGHDQYMLCPSADETMPFARELIDEIVAQHPGVKRLHVGGDEADPTQHGQCPRCPDYLKQHGFSSLYVRHYSQVAQYCATKRVTPLLWSDMILKHPGAITEMPTNVAWVVWDYFTRTDPTPSLLHGAAMRYLNKVSPEYRLYFGAGIGLADAEKRGGLVAFGHALGFKALGFDTFTSPAARCVGDSFDLPRFDTHMDNIQIASRKAAEFGLPGVIVTSWSYRGSPHEVCLPEYACIASAWNRATPGPRELMSQFLAQRYGITDPSLGAAIVGLSPVVPPSCLAQPSLDDARGAWVMGSDHQLGQIREALKQDPKGKARQWQSWRQQVETVSKRLRESATRARHADELRKWELALAHLSHRLEWLQAVAARIVPDSNPQPDQADFSAFETACDRLRASWADAYQDIHTPLSLTAQLYTRFDTEKEITKMVLTSDLFPVNGPPTIVVADEESELTRFARTELVQGIKSQMGDEPIVVTAGKADEAALRNAGVILLGTAERHAHLKRLLSEGWLKSAPTNAQGYSLRIGPSPFPQNRGHWLAALVGSDDLGTLNAVRDFTHYHLSRENSKMVMREADLQIAPKLQARILSDGGTCLFSPTILPAERDKLREMIARGESLVFDKQYYVDWLSEWKATHVVVWWCNTSAHRQAWKEFVDYAHAQGIKVIRGFVPYRPLHEFPPPEIGSLDRPAKTADCPRDPRVRDWYLQRLRQLMTEDPLDGVSVESPYHDGCYCQCDRCKKDPVADFELVEPFLRLARETKPDALVLRGLKAPTRDAAEAASHLAEIQKLGANVDWHLNTFPAAADQERWLDIGPQCGTYLRLFRVALLGKDPATEITAVFDHFRMSAERGSIFHAFSHRFYGGKWGNVREGFTVAEDAEMMRRYPGRHGTFGLALALEAAFDPFVSGEARVEKLQRIRELTIPDYPYDGELDLAALRTASGATKARSTSGSLVVDDPASHPSPGKFLSYLYGISDQGYVIADTCVDYFNDGKRKLLHASRATKKLSMIEAADGRVVWSKAIPGDHQSICAVDPTGRGEFEIFYTTSAPGKLHRLDRTGNILASWDSGDWKLGNSPLLIDGDGDGQLDLYFGSRNRGFFHLSYPDLRVLGKRDGWAQCGCYSSALDVDKSGRWSLFAGSGDDGRGGKGVLHRLNPANLESVWSFRTDDNASSADPVLVDLDGDGHVEIIKSVDNYHHDDAHDAIYAFKTDGKVLWKTKGFSGEQSPNVADLDGDGKPEIVGMTFGGEVYCLDARGKLKWRRDLCPETDDRSHAMNMAPILCDVNGDSQLEIVAFTGSKYFDAAKPGTNLANGAIFILSAKGEVLDKLDVGSPRCWDYGFACNVDSDPHLELVMVGCGHLDVIRTRGFGPNSEVFRKRRTYERNNVYPWSYEDTYFMDRGTRENVVNQTDNLVLARNADGFQRSGRFTTELLTLPPGGFFSQLDCETVQPDGTKITISVFDQKDNVLIANARPHQSLHLTQPVKLRFVLSTADARRTPKLDAYHLAFKRKTPAVAD